MDVTTKKLYDMRKENDLLKIQDQKEKTLISLDMNISGQTTKETIQANTAAVKDWWKKKRRNNQDLLFAAEAGILEEVKSLLDKTRL